MFHHGVWLNLSRTTRRRGFPERFFAVGEEKTKQIFPDGFGYRYEPTTTGSSTTWSTT